MIDYVSEYIQEHDIILDIGCGKYANAAYSMADRFKDLNVKIVGVDPNIEEVILENLILEKSDYRSILESEKLGYLNKEFSLSRQIVEDAANVDARVIIACFCRHDLKHLEDTEGRKSMLKSLEDHGYSLKESEGRLLIAVKEKPFKKVHQKKQPPLHNPGIELQEYMEQRYGDWL